MELVNLADKKKEDLNWPIERFLSKQDLYDEVIIIAKKKDSEGYTRFATALKSPFWWLGVFEVIKQEIANASLKEEDSQ